MYMGSLQVRSCFRKFQRFGSREGKKSSLSEDHFITLNWGRTLPGFRNIFRTDFSQILFLSIYGKEYHCQSYFLKSTQCSNCQPLILFQLFMLIYAESHQAQRHWLGVGGATGKAVEGKKTPESSRVIFFIKTIKVLNRALETVRHLGKKQPTHIIPYKS